MGVGVHIVVETVVARPDVTILSKGFKYVSHAISSLYMIVISSSQYLLEDTDTFITTIYKVRNANDLVIDVTWAVWTIAYI